MGHRRRHGRSAAGTRPGNTHRIHALSWRRDGPSTPGGWHRGLVKIHVMAHAGQFFQGASAPPHGLAAHGYALAAHVHSVAAGGTASLGGLGGGGGIGRLIVHLFIWHLIWRGGLGLWHIPTVGPFLVVLLIAAFAALAIVRKHRGPRWWNSRGGSTGARSGRGPRDW